MWIYFLFVWPVNLIIFFHLYFESQTTCVVFLFWMSKVYLIQYLFFPSLQEQSYLRTTFDIRDKLKKISSARQCSLWKDMKGWIHLLVFASIALKAGALPNSIIATGEDFDLEMGHHLVKGAFGEAPSKTLPKAKRSQGLRAFTKIPDFSYITSCLPNLDQSSGSKSWPILTTKLWRRFSLKILTKFQLQNFYQTPASKSQLNFNFNILTKPQPRYLE